MLDVVEACATDSPAILDLAGGTGSITIRALRRLPQATTTLIDVDPVLLAIARGSLDARTTIVPADLRTPRWLTALPRQRFDAILTATALHWIPEVRLTELYQELYGLLRPDGVFINADHMADDGLPRLSERLSGHQQRSLDADYGAAAAVSWEGWWAQVEKTPYLAAFLAQRRTVFDGWHAAEFAPPAAWHVQALRQAGFSEVGLIWRGGLDAAVAAKP